MKDRQKYMDPKLFLNPKIKGRQKYFGSEIILES